MIIVFLPDIYINKLKVFCVTSICVWPSADACGCIWKKIIFKKRNYPIFTLLFTQIINSTIEIVFM